MGRTPVRASVTANQAQALVGLSFILVEISLNQHILLKMILSLLNGLGTLSSDGTTTEPGLFLFTGLCLALS